MVYEFPDALSFIIFLLQTKKGSESPGNGREVSVRLIALPLEEKTVSAG